MAVKITSRSLGNVRIFTVISIYRGIKTFYTFDVPDYDPNDYEAVKCSIMQVINADNTEADATANANM